MSDTSDPEPYEPSSSESAPVEPEQEPIVFDPEYIDRGLPLDEGHEER